MSLSLRFRQAGRPAALRFSYLAALGAVLVALLAALAVNELRASRRLMTEAMEAGAASLVQAVSRAGENAIRADAQIEAATATRLLGHARLLKELDRQALLSDTLLARLATEAGLYRITVFDENGRRVLANGDKGHGDGAADRQPMDELADVLAGRRDEAVIGFREGRYHAGTRFAAAVGRVGGGAIMVNIDAEKMLAFRRTAGIGRLMQDLGAHADVAYVVLQDRQGVVLASRGVARMGRIAGDPFLESALADDEPRSRQLEHEGKSVFETVLPFWVGPENRGLIRVAQSADAMVAAERRSQRRLAVWAGLLALVGVALMGWIAVRQSYAVLDQAHERVQTYSSRLLEHMGDAVVAVDGEARVEVLNPAAEKLFQLSASQVMGAPVHEALGEGGQIIRQALLESRELRGEACLCRTVDGRQLDLSVSLSLIRDRESQVQVAVAVIQDLTERRALEADLRRRERLSAMGELASGVAHEVRNPLNAIGVIAQRLQREFRPGEDQEEYDALTATVRGEVDRVNRIVRRFLDLARPPALEVRDTDLAAVLSDSLRVAESTASQHGIRVTGDFGGIGRASVDPEQLQQVILNLMVNAIDALTEDGARQSGGISGDGAAAGQSAWEPANAPPEDPAPGQQGIVRLSAERAAGEILIFVSDNGPGIPLEARERIFDLYYTTRQSGTGLGLSLVQRIVAEHGGRIDLDTEEGRGTTFTVHLPADSGTTSWRKGKPGTQNQPA